MKKNQSLRAIQAQRFLRYSIRKFTVGVASVAIASGLAVLGSTNAQAAEEVVNTPATETKAPEAGKNVKTDVVEKVNTSKLTEAIERFSQLLDKVAETDKTTATITAAKELLTKAQQAVSRTDIQQSEVDKFTSELTSKAYVLESMPKLKDKATEKVADKITEEKVNKNQDPRNGKAIPGKGESGFRADTFIVNESNTTTVPNTATTGTDKFTFVAIPENDSRRNNKVIAIADGQAGDIEVKGTGNAPTDLEIEMYSSQRTGKQENPVAMSTVNGQPVTSPGRMDYPLSKEQVQKLQEEAKLWRNKEKPDGNRISNNPATVYGSSGAYEFLATEIYKLGYEQGVDRAYIPNISNRFAVTDKAKEAGWKIKSISPTNLPSGLIYDKESDSIQGRVVSNVQNGVQDLRFTVEAENEKTHQIVSMEFKNLRSGWIAWQDSKPPRLEVSNDAYETQVGQNVDIDIAYKDDAGSNFSGSRRQVNYRLASGKVVTIPNQNFRQAVSGLAGYATTNKAGELDGTKTSIPGISYTLSQDGTPVETDENGNQSIYGKGKLTGTATTAGIYTVSVFAKDYNTTQKSDSTWIHSGHEVQKYITVVVKPTITVKNVHAYATTIPVTISDGASTAEVKLPNGKITKLEVRDGQWVVASGTTNEKAVQGTALGQVGSEINIPVSEEDTKTASTDTIVAKAITENVKATLLRNELSLTDNNGVHKARLDETTGHWELDKNYREVKESTPDGGYKLTKRQVFTEVQNDGTKNYYIYSYTRTYNANDKIVSVNEVRRDKTVVPRLNTENQEGNAVVVEYNPVTQTWTSSDNSRVTATKEGNFWNIRTESGFTGLVKGSIAESDDKASILNNAPTATSTSYTTVKGATVDLVKQASAAVTIRDTEDDATTSPKKETTITKVTVIAPSGQQTEYTDIEQAKAHLLSEVGTYTVKVEVKDSNGNVVTADTETDTGTNKGADTAVNSTTYTITVKDQETKKLYKVEDDTVTNDELKGKVEPTTIDGFTPTKNDFTNIPTTAGKAGQTLPTPATVTYTKGTETISVATKVDVVVLPKATPEKVTTLKDTTSDNLTTAVKEKAQAALGKLTLPTGVTAELDPTQTYAVPATDSNGDKDNVPVKVQYKDATGTVVAEDTINVPVTVVSSTPSKIVVFEGDEVTADTVKGAVTPGTDGTKGTPVIPTDLTKQSGEKEVTVPVTYEGIKDPEQVKVPVTVLPKPEADEILVPKNSDKEKAKEKVLAQAEKAIADGTFTGKLPQGATVTVDNTVPVTIPELTDDTEVEVTVKYTVPGQDKPLTTTVKVPVTVVEGVPQIVPVKETNDVLPEPEKSVDKEDYPEGSTFRYKTPDGQTTPIDVTTTGDKNVIVEVLDPQGNTIVEVPATVRVVGSTPQFVVADPTKKQPEAKDSVTPGEYPDGTTFEYKTPVDTTTAGEKDVTVVAKLNGQPIVEVPAKVVVVDPKTQYVVADPSKPQPDASKSIDPEQYPEGTTFEYKTPVDTTTPGEKDVVVIAKDGEDKLVEVPTKVKVVQGNPQIVPVDEGKKQPSPEDSIDPNDYPEDATFEYKEEVDTSTPGDKKVTVVVKQGDKVLVEVPSTVRVVESYPKYVPVDPAKKQPDPKENINPNEFPTGTTFEYKDNTPVDTTTPGEKTVTVVAKLNGQPIAEIPATIVVVEPKTQYVPVNAENDKKPKPQNSITPDDYPEDSTFEYKTPEGQTTPYDGTTPGEKDVTVVVKDPDGDTIVEVPAKIKVVQGKEQLTPVNAEDKDKPKAEDSITPSDYPEGSTFEYKVPEGQTTPYDGSTPGDKPVTVVVKDKNGNVLVEVPTTIKVVESKPTPIETPVTNTPLKEEDYTKGLNIPEGATAKVGNLPDLTTPGEKTPVKVTITLPNGKSYTVDVPVTVTPVKEIETPVTTDKLTPEDILKQIKVPEGATTNVGDLPDLTTPGKKDPVKVIVTLPNGKVVTVDVPVNVTPVKEIETPVTTEKLTPEDILKQIKVPEGATTNVGDLPDLTTPGKKDPVKVTVTLPNGKVVTVDVPVNVTPVKEIETPVTTTPLTPEDYTKGITIPEGGKVTKVENIPDLTTPGKKTPVKVTIELPNGKIITVEVPVNVTPVKEIETPVTKDKLTPEDILKQIKVPEGATVEVGDLPDLTTPGKKDPVKVTITLPNGKVVTVEVPVNVTPITPIETPVTKDKLTPEDILKQIKVPEGATTKVENIPDLTTPGKKDPVKVTITLPNGKVVIVEIPVTVTPIEGIVKKEGDPITNEDVEKHIPKGAKVISIGDKPTTDVPGERPSIPVVIELPNGIRVTMNIPVIVTPKVTPVVVSVGTPVTPEDVKNHIDLPKGWKVTKVGEIPTTTTPGTKPVVPVEIELPDGRKITVDVPVIVTSTVRQIVVPQGTPITPDDVKGHIDLPKEPGWEIVEVGEIPTTIPAGVKPSVKVKIKVPTGEIIEVEVPIIVTPKVTPIVVEVGTPITKEDVKKKVGLPEGWEIVEIGEIPTTETPGTKPVVKVKVKLPDGRIITVEVPVTVTPKSQNGGGIISQNGDSTVQIVTEYLDENGNRITSDKEGKHNPIELEGYEFSHSTTDAKGNTLHHYKKVTPKTPQAVEEVPTTKPEQPSTPEVKPTPVAKQELPNTGTAELEVFTPAVLAILTGLGLAAPTVAKKKDEE